jgi:hypothetical protein
MYVLLFAVSLRIDCHPQLNFDRTLQANYLATDIIIFFVRLLYSSHVALEWGGKLKHCFPLPF